MASGRPASWSGSSTGKLVWELDRSEVSDAVREQLRLAARGDDYAEVMRWVPNVRRPGVPQHVKWDQFWDGKAYAVVEFDPTAEMAWLDAAFAKERTILAVMYGEGNVATRWGLIRWSGN